MPAVQVNRVVDDSPVDRVVLGQLLSKLILRIVLVSSGQYRLPFERILLEVAHRLHLVRLQVDRREETQDSEVPDDVEQIDLLRELRLCLGVTLAVSLDLGKRVPGAAAAAEPGVLESTELLVAEAQNCLRAQCRLK